MPWMAPVTLAKAGAITTLNRIGVRRGTTISRGVRADRAKRRRVRVANGPARERGARWRSGIVADDATFVDDGNPVAPTLGLVEVVRREEDRHLALFPNPADQVEKLEPDAWVQADCGLVEEQHLRVRDEGAGDLESTALAAAVALDRAVRLGGQVEGVEQVVDTVWRHVLGHAPQPSVDLEVAPAR